MTHEERVANYRQVLDQAAAVTRASAPKHSPLPRRLEVLSENLLQEAQRAPCQLTGDLLFQHLRNAVVQTCETLGSYHAGESAAAAVSLLELEPLLADEFDIQLPDVFTYPLFCQMCAALGK